MFRETKPSYDPSPRGELKAAVGEIRLDNRAAWIDGLASPLEGLGDVSSAASTQASRTAANDNSRRLWFASFDRFAELRSASAE